MDKSNGRPSPVPWPPLLLAAAVGGGIVLQRLAPLTWPGLDDLPARVIGLGIGALGIALAVWAIATLIRARTTVRPDRGASVLVTWGPFARWRNPIYVADVMILLGLAELTKNIWLAILAALFAMLVTWLAILPEERHLEATFGDAWRAYKERSRRWI
jgi:protein-S-isoprenylcysteine O-methyltransferase Ste14